MTFHWKPPGNERSACGNSRFGSIRCPTRKPVCKDCLKAYRAWKADGRRRLRQINETLKEMGESLPVCKGPSFNQAILGIGQQFNQRMIVYDRTKCIDILMIEHGMTHEEAEDFFSFNTEGAYIGKDTPLFLTRFEDLQC